MGLNVRLRSLVFSPQARGSHQKRTSRFGDRLSDDKSENCVDNATRNTEEEEEGHSHKVPRIVHMI